MSITPIASGRTAEIYPWTGSTVLKLYHAWCPPHWVEEEAAIARRVWEAGIPSPAPGEIVEQDGRRGLVYQRIQGRSLLEEIERAPWRLVWAARLMAGLHAQIHALEVPGLPSYRESLLAAVQRAPYLSAEQRQRAAAQALALPDSLRLCHADFHPGNILVTAQGPVVIDWMTARAGDPWADVARTHMLMDIGVRGVEPPLPPPVRLVAGLMLRLYLARYRRLAGPDGGRLQAWQPVIAAARLLENIAPERQALLDRLR